MAFKYSSYDHYYDISQLDEFLDEVGELEIIDKNNSLSYFNVPAAFDIETTSTEYNGAKFATMYIWQFGINGVSIYGNPIYSKLPDIHCCKFCPVVLSRCSFNIKRCRHVEVGERIIFVYNF